MLKWLALLLATLLLAGCGQTGKLYLPEEASTHAPTTPFF